MRDKTKAQNAPSLELRPANENPWYVLMTLYGDAYGKNRKVWNSWAAQVLTDEEKLAYEELGRVDKRDSHGGSSVIQAGICYGGQFGTRPDDRRGMGVL